MFEEKGRLILSMWYFPRFVLYFVFSVLFPIILCFSCVVFQAHSTLLTPPLYFISPETSSHQLTYSTSQQDTHLSPYLTSPSPHTSNVPFLLDLMPAKLGGTETSSPKTTANNEGENEKPKRRQRGRGRGKGHKRPYVKASPPTSMPAEADTCLPWSKLLRE